jgi:ATP synthase protein I
MLAPVMRDMPQRERPSKPETFLSKIGAKSDRKLLARHRERHVIWFGMRLFGLVGWSIVVSTLGGVALGAWIDRHWPSSISWTLTLLFVGILFGCWQAWDWIKRENRRD